VEKEIHIIITFFVLFNVFVFVFFWRALLGVSSFSASAEGCSRTRRCHMLMAFFKDAAAAGEPAAAPVAAWDGLYRKGFFRQTV